MFHNYYCFKIEKLLRYLFQCCIFLFNDIEKLSVNPLKTIALQSCKLYLLIVKYKNVDKNFYHKFNIKLFTK